MNAATLMGTTASRPTTTQTTLANRSFKLKAPCEIHEQIGVAVKLLIKKFDRIELSSFKRCKESLPVKRFSK